MASKTKMRCATCGKWFQSANAKDTTCPECTQKARKEKLAAKAAPQAPVKATTVQHTSPSPPKPKQAKSGTNQWLDSLSDVKVAEPDKPARPKIPFSPAPRDTRGESRDNSVTGNTHEEQGPPANYREREFGNRGPNNYRENNARPNSPYRVGGGAGLPDGSPRPRQPMESGFNRGPRPDRPPRPAGQSGPKSGKPKVKTPKPLPEPKPKREKIEPPKPFEPTTEQIAQVEARYLELATPIEFDGIRTQIAQELEIPKTAVKKIIKDLRDRQHMPSWWDAQSYKGSEEELAKIKVAYEPYLPLPDVGIHKQIAEQLTLKAGDVYQAIKMIRTQMGLPQYNDPELHGIELKPRKSTASETQTSADTEEKTEASTATEVKTEISATEQASSGVLTNTEEKVETPTSAEEKVETPTNAEAPVTTDTTSAPVPTDALNGTDTGAVVEGVKEETK